MKQTNNQMNGLLMEKGMLLLAGKVKIIMRELQKVKRPRELSKIGDIK